MPTDIQNIQLLWSQASACLEVKIASHGNILHQHLRPAVMEHRQGKCGEADRELPLHCIIRGPFPAIINHHVLSR